MVRYGATCAAHGTLNALSIARRAPRFSRQKFLGNEIHWERNQGFFEERVFVLGIHRFDIRPDEIVEERVAVILSFLMCFVNQEKFG